MSFAAFNAQSFADSAAIYGVETFAITGLSPEFTGILNEFAAEKQIDLGGIVGTYTATLMCELDQFDDIEGSLERALDGRTLTLAGRTYKISRCALDDTALTLGLTNPAKGK